MPGLNRIAMAAVKFVADYGMPVVEVTGGDADVVASWVPRLPLADGSRQGGFPFCRWWWLSLAAIANSGGCY